MHIDATMMPLAPGKLLINPERLTRIPAAFRSWDVRPAPAPSSRADFALCTAGSAMNVLSLDEKRVIVEPSETELIRFFKSWGFEPILAPSATSTSSAGRSTARPWTCRRGELRSYF